MCIIICIHICITYILSSDATEPRPTRKRAMLMEVASRCPQGIDDGSQMTSCNKTLIKTTPCIPYDVTKPNVDPM